MITSNALLREQVSITHLAFSVTFLIDKNIPVAMLPNQNQFDSFSLSFEHVGNDLKDR